MSFDVYVGTMTRYYRREWENVVQRMAREQGVEYRMIRAGGDGPLPAAEEVQGAVRLWCDAMTKGLGTNLPEPITWSEADDQPYFTDRPGWPGYSGLLVWAANDEHPDLPPPETLPESWTDDPAFQRSTREGFRSEYSHILNPGLWLPIDLPFWFEFGTLTDEKATPIGSTFMLRRQLQCLAERTRATLIQANAHTPIAEPVAPAPQPGFFSRMFGGKARAAPLPLSRQEPERLTDAALAGLNIFMELSEKACQHRLPLMLSF